MSKNGNVKIRKFSYEMENINKKFMYKMGKYGKLRAEVKGMSEKWEEDEKKNVGKKFPDMKFLICGFQESFSSKSL